MGLEIELDERFKECALPEMPAEDFESCIQKVWEDHDFSFPGGESNNCAQKRGIEGLVDVLVKYRGKRIAIGTHGNIMAIMMNFYDSKYGYEFWKDLSMLDIYKLSFKDNKLIDVKRIYSSS